MGCQNGSISKRRAQQSQLYSPCIHQEDKMFVIMASLDGMDYYVAYANDQYCLVPVADYDSSKHALTVNSNKSIAIKMT